MAYFVILVYLNLMGKITVRIFLGRFGDLLKGPVHDNRENDQNDKRQNKHDAKCHIINVKEPVPGFPYLTYLIVHNNISPDPEIGINRGQDT